MKKLFYLALILLLTSCNPVVVISFNALIGVGIILAIAAAFFLYLAYLWLREKVLAIFKYFKKLFGYGKKSNRIN
jgi:hypothetical protein